jgi:hypothetical protein
MIEDFMTEKQEGLLNRRFQEAISEQPEIESLRALLLRLGGIQLVAPPRLDPTVPLLIIAGFVMAGSVQRVTMEESRCHQNAARVWSEKYQGIVAIGTGYALSEDGLWRQHSWGVLREGILETTVPRAKYFGLLLQGGDADCFAESNLEDVGGNMAVCGS